MIHMPETTEHEPSVHSRNRENAARSSFRLRKDYKSILGGSKLRPETCKMSRHQEQRKWWKRCRTSGHSKQVDRTLQSTAISRHWRQFSNQHPHPPLWLMSSSVHRWMMLLTPYPMGTATTRLPFSTLQDIMREREWGRFAYRTIGSHFVGTGRGDGGGHVPSGNLQRPSWRFCSCSWDKQDPRIEGSIFLKYKLTHTIRYTEIKTTKWWKVIHSTETKQCLKSLI